MAEAAAAAQQQQPVQLAANKPAPGGSDAAGGNTEGDQHQQQQQQLRQAALAWWQGQGAVAPSFEEARTAWQQYVEMAGRSSVKLQAAKASLSSAKQEVWSCCDLLRVLLLGRVSPGHVTATLDACTAACSQCAQPPAVPGAAVCCQHWASL
eukprot:scaffold216532_cov22-Tisochrysis_lutea.AAC.1